MRFRNLISDLSGERVVILSTHIVSDVEATATDIAIMDGGRLLAHAVPEELLRSAEGRVWEWVVPSAELPVVRERHTISGRRFAAQDGVHVRIVADEPPSDGARPATPTLEDAYLRTISAGRAAERTEGTRV